MNKMTTAFEALAPEMGNVADDALAQAKAGYEQISGKVRELMEKNMKSMAEITDFTKGNVEALLASAKAATSGAETLASHFVETSRKQMEGAQSAVKTVTSVKSPTELFQVQNEFAKAQFDNAVASWSQLSEMMLKVAGEVVQPLSNRVAIAAETVKKSAAI